MPFQLVRRRIFSRPSLALSDLDGSALAAAIEGLRTMLSFEDKYYVLVENFLELEITLAGIAARYMVRPLISGDEFSDAIREANRRVINLLTACRLYRDQTTHHMSSVLEAHRVRAFFDEERDGRLEVRVAEALRNHVQHRDLPVHRLSIGSRWTETEPPQMRFHTRLDLRIEQLAEDPRFSEAIVQELRSLDESPDLRVVLREYVSSMARIHRKLREGAEQQQESWVTLVRWADDFEAAAENPDDISMDLHLLQFNDQGKETQSWRIYSGLIGRLSDLQRRNYCSDGLGRSYVTTEAA